MKKLIFTLLLSVTSGYVWAQEGQNYQQHVQDITTSVPKDKDNKPQNHFDQLKAAPAQLSNYGSLVIDWGINFLQDHPYAMNVNYWGSRAASGSIYYNIRLGRSHFTISPGIGITFNRYQFDDKGNTLVRDKESRNTILKKTEEQFPKSEIAQSTWNMRYVNFMLQARFNANSKRPKEGLFVAIGGRMCLLWRASTTVKYKEDNETKTQNNKECFNLNKTRWGAHAMLGWGRFGLCYTRMFSNLFKRDKGPDNNATKTHSITLSVDLF